MKFWLIVIGILFILLPQVSVAASSFTDSSQADFDKGDYGTNTVYNTSASAIEIKDKILIGGVAAGTYTSSVKNSGSSGTTWESFSWVPYQAYGKALPDYGYGVDGTKETVYTSNFSALKDNVGLWHLDNLIKDNTTGISTTPDTYNLSSTHDGTCGTAGIFCPVAGVVGKFSTGVEFNWKKQYILMSSFNPSYNAIKNTTWSVWIKPIKPAASVDPNYDDNAHFILSDGNIGRGMQINWKDNTTPGASYYSISIGKWALPSKPHDNYKYTGVLVDYNQWQHLALVYNGNSVSFYKNGKLVFGPTTVNILDQGTQFMLGNNKGLNTTISQYYGSMDEVAVFNTALSETDIQNLYIRGAAQLGLQIKTCSTSSCSDGSYVGPYMDTGASNTLPAITVPDALSPKQYFQYQATLTTTDNTITPKLQSVTVTGTVPPASVAPVSSARIDWSQCHVEQNAADVIIKAGEIKTVVVLQGDIPHLNKAFLLVNSTGDSKTVNAADHLISGYISSATTLTFERGGNVGEAKVSYAVVFCNLNEFSVQRGELSIGVGSTAGSNPLTTAVEVDRSIVMVSARTGAAQATEKNGLVTGFTDGATITAQRGGTEGTTAVRYEVVTFSEDAQVKIASGPAVIASGQLKVEAPIDNLNVAEHQIWLYCSYNTTGDSVAAAAVGCHNTENGLTAEFVRSDPGSYINTIYYYAIAFPPNTVRVNFGIDDNNPDTPDGTYYEDNIALSPQLDKGATAKTFAFVTNTTKDNGSNFPRNLWLSQVMSQTELRTSFWRGDGVGNNDANTKYWQVIQFPLYSAAANIGWIGNAPDNGTSTGVGYINFNCDNFTTAYQTTCVSSSDPSFNIDPATQRWDYKVELENGDGCGDHCQVNGLAWLGDYSENDPNMPNYSLGWVDFDPDLTNKPGFVTEGAYWNEDTGELFGWARILSLANYGNTIYGSNDWGWLKLQGVVNDGTNTNYGVHYDLATKSFFGWSWNDDGSLAGNKLLGTGLGWIKFDADITSNLAWLQTLQGDVYAGGGFTTKAAPSGQYNATYLIQANGDITNFTSEYAATQGADYAADSQFGSITITDNDNNVYRGTIGDLHVSELIQQAKQEGHSYDDCNFALQALKVQPVLGGSVFYCSGDMIVKDELTFYNGVDSELGNGTIVVGGDLTINVDSHYANKNLYNSPVINNTYNVAAVAWIAQGSIHIDPSVTQLVGAYIALSAAQSGTATFTTGNANAPAGANNLQLVMAGLIMAEQFSFDRKVIGEVGSTSPDPAEVIIYDPRLATNPPPGLEDLSKVLPEIE